MEITAVNTIINVPSGLQARQVEPLRATTGASEDALDSAISIATVGTTGATGEAAGAGDLSAAVGELLSALAQRLQERTETSLNVSVSINVIKANLGSLLSGLLADTSSDIFDNLLAENLGGSQLQEVSPDVRARLFSALATAGLDDGDLFTSAGTLAGNSGSGIIGALGTGSTDGRELLLSLLVNELSTPADDAISIISVLQESRFEIVA